MCHERFRLTYSSFIEHKDVGRGEEGPRKRNQLPLALAEVGSCV